MTRRRMAGWWLTMILAVALPARAEVVTQLNITGGSVAFNFSGGNTTIPVFNESFTQTGTLLMGQYQALNGPIPVLPTFTLVSGALAETFSIFTNPGPDVHNPLPAPSGTISGNTIQVNLNSLFAAISGFPINGGLNIGNVLPALATGTFNADTGAFHIAWDHIYTLPSDFVGIGSFSLQGNTGASPIPLPAAAVLFASGLALLGRIGRRRR
jgi:hypothetical protein